MATKESNQTFLLVLAGPHDEMPVRVFQSEKDLLRWAANNPPYPVVGPGVQPESEVQEAHSMGPGWSGTSEGDSELPFGYRAYRFGPHGELLSHAVVEPFTYYEPRPGPALTRGVDFDQELNWE